MFKFLAYFDCEIFGGRHEHESVAGRSGWAEVPPQHQEGVEGEKGRRVEPVVAVVGGGGRVDREDESLVVVLGAEGKRLGCDSHGPVKWS